MNKYSYEPFGTIESQTELIPQPFKYVGQYGVMAETNGLYLMGARYYDPKVGRFISEDPIGFEGGTINLSEYVGNNPVNYIDPEGLQRTSVDVAIERALARGDVAELEALLEATGNQAAKAAINRLRTKATDLIAKECKGSIRSEFPGEMMDKTLEQIVKAAKSGDKAAQTAKKLLTELRFKK